MKTFKVLSTILVLASAVSAQYNFPGNQQDDSDGYQYQKPTQPPRAYLPPTTQKPYESERDIAAEGLGPPKDDTAYEPGMPFDFTYAVKDDFGNDFSHKADSDGEVVKGEYRTLLPDGRLQIVKYTADWKNGYNAEVAYEGEAVYPEEQPKAQTPAPYRPPAQTPAPYRPPAQSTPPRKNPYENEEDIDSQGLYPSKAPATRPPYVAPTTTYRPVYTQPPTTQRPTTQFQCYQGSRDPRCPQPTTQFQCYPGSTDPRCPQPTTTYRPTTQYVPRTTQPPYRPAPTTQGYVYTRPPTTQAPRTTQPPPVEPPGLYGAPALPFGVRNNPKFGYSK